MADILKVKNISLLQALKNHSDGEIAYCEQEAQYMVYKNNQWNPIEAKMNNNGLEFNLYDLNK